MAIILTVNESLFIEHFRVVRPDNFSYDALDALFNYYEELSNDIGENIEFDPIGICCEWTEYDSFNCLVSDYSHLYDGGEDIAEDDIDNFMEALQDETHVIEVRGGKYLVMNF